MLIADSSRDKPPAGREWRLCGAKQYSAAVGANKEISILTGIRVERAEIGAPGEFDQLSDDELERGIVERLVQLGLLTQALAISDGSITPNGGSDDD
jgi:hypothetical protein